MGYLPYQLVNPGFLFTINSIQGFGLPSPSPLMLHLCVKKRLSSLVGWKVLVDKMLLLGGSRLEIVVTMESIICKYIYICVSFKICKYLQSIKKIRQKIIHQNICVFFFLSTQHFEQTNYFTSSDPHHDMLGEGCQVGVVKVNWKCYFPNS